MNKKEDQRAFTPLEAAELSRIRSLSLRYSLVSLALSLACIPVWSFLFANFAALLLLLGAAALLYRADSVHSAITLGHVRLVRARVESRWAGIPENFTEKDSYYVLEFDSDSPFYSVCVTKRVYNSSAPGGFVVVAYSEAGRRVVGVNGEPASGHSEERPIRHHIANMLRWWRR